MSRRSLLLKQIYGAEIYAQELGIDDIADDAKVNYGEQLLKAALYWWVKGLSSIYVSSGTANG